MTFNTLTERQQEIMAWLQAEGHLSTDQLSQRFAVSSQTIRRNINELSAMGLVRRQHGGLSLPAAQHNQSFSKRSAENLLSKQCIARTVVASLPPHATLFLGYGTTVQQVAALIPADLPLRVITNNLQALAALLDKPAVETWVTGGRLRQADQDLMGLQTLQAFERFEADIALCGIAGIAADGSLLEFQQEEAELTRVLLQHSRQHWLLADASKYQRLASARLGSLDAFDALFTDQDNPALAQLCQKFGVDFTVCQGAA
ncbi:DeoR/GlpR family DNA-binding transcription regulator [Chitinimonas sp.]|uniref:DeoR/GlpR family DNA-binding transcription regulator n=1 Tax=Chitinimonas sp. TaxID=1934313 RepID=UPI0035AE02FA